MSEHKTFQTRKPTCPHCGHAMTDDEMLQDPGDLYRLPWLEGTGSTTCPKCDQTYHVQGGYIPHYTSAKRRLSCDHAIT